MSEFSESYHLEADDQQDSMHLLQRAALEGVVFPPQRGWVTIVPRSQFGAPPERLLEANEGGLLRYLLDQDAGWMFHGHDPQLLEPQRILHPRIVRRTSQETGEHYDSFAEWPAGETLDNVAYTFARFLALPHYQWLRWRDDPGDMGDWSQHGAVRAGS